MLIVHFICVLKFHPKSSYTLYEYSILSIHTAVLHSKEVLPIGLVSFLLLLELSSLQAPSVTANPCLVPALVDRGSINHTESDT